MRNTKFKIQNYKQIQKSKILNPKPFKFLGGGFVICLLFGALYFGFSTPAFAHILLTDGSIGAVVHISPEDDPITREKADFFFEFKDKTNRFNPQNCDCRYQVSLNEKEIASGNLFGGDVEPSLGNASFSLVFPEKGIYTLLINGKPVTPGEFDEFTLKDTVRIERTPEASSDIKSQTNFFTTHYLLFKVFGVGLAIFLVLLFIKIIKSR